MSEVEREILRRCEAGEQGCIATLIRSSGSVPMSRRAKLLVCADGSLRGTIGGGCLEAEVWQRARDVIRDGTARSFRSALNQEDALESGLICGGSVEILLQPLGGAAMADVYREVAALQAGGGRGVLATVADAGVDAAPGDHLLVCADGRQVGHLRDAALRAAILAEAPRVLREEMPRLVRFRRQGDPEEQPDEYRGAEGGARVFLDPVVPIPTLFVFGGGHVGLYTAQVGAMVGMRVVVVDDRAAFANRERFPQADEAIVAEFDRVFDRLTVDESSYIVIVTRGHRHDETVLERALCTPARYIGMIGSRRKVKVVFDRLRERGVAEESLARVHTPIGLEIHADTPEEIAVSILAEIITIRRARLGLVGKQAVCRS
ncbi:MAG: XdhC family protein [Armatimonadetes bacterium]|nr:XdhC family protein [Armatimonadota bacterium]